MDASENAYPPGMVLFEAWLSFTSRTASVVDSCRDFKLENNLVETSAHQWAKCHLFIGPLGIGSPRRYKVTEHQEAMSTW